MKYIKHNLLIWLSGGDPTSLANASISEQRKYIKLGMVILVPAIMSWAGMWFAGPYIGLNEYTRWIVATIWAAVILAIDTYLVSTLDKRLVLTNKKRYISLAFFRILISIFLGIIISHPIVLKILEPNILEEIGNMKKEEMLKILAANKDSATAWNNTNKKELQTMDRVINCWEELLMAEGNGRVIINDCGSSSGKASRGFRYKRMEKEIDSLKESRRLLLASVKGVEIKFNTIASADTAQLNSSFSYDYLKRTTALERLKEKDKNNGSVFSHTSLLVWILLAFFILLDSMAVIAKVMTPIGLQEDLLTIEEHDRRRRPDAEKNRKFEVFNTALLHERQYKESLIQAIYSRGTIFTPKEIKIAVEGVLNDGIKGPQPSPAPYQNASSVKRQYIFLGGACLLGAILWYVCKITICKNAPEDLAIVMSSYFSVIAIIAGILK